MEKHGILHKSLQGAAMGASFGIALFAVGAVYASWGILTQVNTSGAGTQLSSSEWNKMVANLETIDSKLSSVSVPTGGVVAFVGTACPTGWSPADGTSNGVKKTDGTSTTLDLRGEFIRGLDGGRNVDVGRALGTAQPDIIKAHNHGFTLDGNAGTAFLRFGNPNATWGISDTGNTNHFTTTSGGANLDAANTETRPRNVALLYCVKN